ncbi:5'/3'-nucleotidase SurE [Stappia sp. ES.058]|uniref:5'/3'-nucleotidase SurE n=1 Tax=Stappia sp. ES.058 TaxID=1881061 RepID=UPI00087C9F70|nr:5'/3'-nucleotidase SurE [Stappia sp. ES.058]SDU12407.1 5'-nucleotidase /3'-nucleotidase /exopolyphosphatase [Stappia sp. ES.058]
MRILVTNDDGIQADGLPVLEDVARTLSDDVWVVAPETDQSGVAHSLTLHDPLRVRELGDQRYSVRGTPTDCVIMGVRELLPGRPDLILSGVNRGQNAADDVTYSGTIAGAMEGTLMGIRSMALSQAFSWGKGAQVDYEATRAHAASLVRKLLSFSFPSDILLNLNFPACAPEDVRGTRVTRQGKRKVSELAVDARTDGRGVPYYWLAFRGGEETPPEDTDLAALSEHMISVTPLKLDLTAHDLLGELKDKLA